MQVDGQLLLVRNLFCHSDKIIENVNHIWDKSSMHSLWRVLAVVGVFSVLPVYGEDWTVDGKTYHNVTVGQVEADRVHITYDGGLGTVALADLTPDLQKRFGYNAANAKATSDKRASDATKADAQILSDLAAQANRAEAENPKFLRDWSSKVQEEAAAATSTDEQAHAKTQQLRLEYFTKLIASSMYARDDIREWMDAAMTGSVCKGMPRSVVLVAWGPPDSETKNTDGDSMMTYGTSSFVCLSSDVVTSVSVTTAGSSQ